MLKYATADQSEQSLETVNCNEILRTIELNIDAQLKATEGQLIVESLPMIQAHPTLITQVSDSNTFHYFPTCHLLSYSKD